MEDSRTKGPVHLKHVGHFRFIGDVEHIMRLMFKGHKACEAFSRRRRRKTLTAQITLKAQGHMRQDDALGTKARDTCKLTYSLLLVLTIPSNQELQYYC